MRRGILKLTGYLVIPALLMMSCVPATTDEGGEVVPQEKTAQVVEPEPEVEQPKPEPVPEPAPEPEPEPQPEPEPEPEEPPEPQFTDTLPDEPEQLAVPPHKYQELAEYALELINRDRTDNGLDPVVLAGNTASQAHAEEDLANGTDSHWAADGSKPYMRYTAAGGVDYVAENVIGTGVASGGTGASRDIKELITEAEQRFMESPKHRENILNRWHKKVSLGIAYDDTGFALVQNFEGDYIRFSGLPAISGTILTLSGRAYLGQIDRVDVYYDPIPTPLTPSQLNAPPYDSTYSLGSLAAYVIPPPPAGSFYTNLQPTDVVATTWQTTSGGSFNIGANLNEILARNGSGVYTVVFMVKVGGESVMISNYSIQVP